MGDEVLVIDEKPLRCIRRADPTVRNVSGELALRNISTHFPEQILELILQLRQSEVEVRGRLELLRATVRVTIKETKI